MASAAVTALGGARPVFAEVKGMHDLTVDPQDIERRITDRTKALVVMHYDGYVCDMEPLLALARHYQLFVIEDAAHAPLIHEGNTMAGYAGGYRVL